MRSAGTLKGNTCYACDEQEGMSLVQYLLERVGRTSDKSGNTYRCIRCGTGFDRRYHECPACGVPHAVGADQTDE